MSNVNNIWRSRGSLESLLIRRKQSLTSWLEETGFRTHVEVELWCINAKINPPSVDALDDAFDATAPVPVPTAPVPAQQPEIELPKPAIVDLEELVKVKRSKFFRNALVELPVDTQHDLDLEDK